MSCDSFLTFGAKSIVNSGGITGIQLLSASGLGALSSVFVSLTDCQTARDLIPSNYVLNDPSGVVHDDELINLGDLTFTGPALAVVAYNLATFDASFNSTPRGFLTVTMHADGIGYDVEDHSDISWPLAYTPSLIMLTTSNGVGSDDILVHTNKTAVVALDYPGFLGCAVPACALNPATDPVAFNPSVGIRCANFSKVVNPFGFQRGK